MAVKTASAADLEHLAGEWVAEDAHGHVIAHAHGLPELERVLVTEKQFRENELPAIRRVPEDGQTTFVL